MIAYGFVLKLGFLMDFRQLGLAFFIPFEDLCLLILTCGRLAFSGNCRHI